ncbi:MAG: branched chain amino acid aminotransferase, partial [Anaerolineales bacterium]
ETLGITVVERRIDRTEVYLVDELFMTGTAAQIVAVTKVDHRPIGEGKMGPVTTQLRGLYDQVVRCQHPEYRSWTEPVYTA